MAAASLGVECSLRGQRQIRRSFGRCTRPSKKYPFVEQRNGSMPAWVLEVSRHSRGPGALAWRGARSIGRLASPARGVEWGRVPRRAIQRVGRAPCHPRRGVGADAGASRGEGSPMMSLLGRLAAVAVGHFGAGFQCTCPWANGVPSGQLPFASPPPRRRISMPTACGERGGEGFAGVPGASARTPHIFPSSTSFPSRAVKMYPESRPERHQPHGKLPSLPVQWQEAPYTHCPRSTMQTRTHRYTVLGVSAIQQPMAC